MQGRPVPGCLEWEEQLRELGCPEGFLAPGCQGSLNSPTHSFFFLIIYLFLAVMGLHRCMQAFSSRGKWGLLLVAVLGLLIAVLLLLQGTRALGHVGSVAAPRL